jgi:hypothetical protein
MHAGCSSVFGFDSRPWKQQRKFDETAARLLYQLDVAAVNHCSEIN